MGGGYSTGWVIPACAVLRDVLIVILEPRSPFTCRAFKLLFTLPPPPIKKDTWEKEKNDDLALVSMLLLGLYPISHGEKYISKRRIF